tara:strand:+ start:1293 stop:2147 length:855 start_codon:yes stop_codon:yes gene_type:complete
MKDTQLLLGINKLKTINKKYFYFTGLPRAGNTLLSAILNENPDVHATGHSFLPDVLFAIKNAEQHSLCFQNYPCPTNLKNVYKNIIPNYYSHHDFKYIVERGDWITPYNYNVLQTIAPNQIKIVILVRDILEVIKSYLKLCKDNPNYFYNKIYNSLDHSTLFTGEIETKVDLIMAKGDYVDTMLYSIHQLKKNNLIKNFLLIDYNDLTNNPSKTINKIYNYYGIKTFKHSFTKLQKQQPFYNDSVLGAPMHELKSGPIRKINYDIELPENVINKYKHLNKILYE